MMQKDTAVLVLGGTGHYGRRIVQSLLEAGRPVRVLSRNPIAARNVLGEGPAVLKGDITKPTSVQKALEGVLSVVIAVAAHSPNLIRQRIRIERDGVLGVLEAARRTGLTRVVYLSGYDVSRKFAERLGILDFARPMLDVQGALAGSDFDWTVLGCPPSMEIFFKLIRKDVMSVPGGGPPSLPTVSPLDLGAVAAQAAVRDDLGGRHIRVPGPEALSFPEAARRISSVWGRQIRFRRIPLAPIRIGAFVTRPFSPYLSFLVSSLKVLNGFPQDISRQVPEDHRRLLDTFSFKPTSIENEARERMRAGS